MAAAQRSTVAPYDSEQVYSLQWFEDKVIRSAVVDSRGGTEPHGMNTVI